MHKKMITVREAEKIIAAQLKESAIISCRLEQTYGAILREDIRADRDIPAFHKVLMDGVALKLSIRKKGIRKFKLQGTQAAGDRPLVLNSSKNCIEIMTGAVLPVGCDCVVPVEKIKFKGATIEIAAGLQVIRLQNVQPRGSDYKKGQKVLKRYQRLLAPQIAVAAAVAKRVLRVSRSPQIAVISTGNELVDIDRPVKPYQIRKSNSYALQAALARNGFENAKIFHVRDNEKQIFSRLQKILKRFDVLIISGGVSMGKYDFIPRVLAKLKVRVLFHKVRQKPGKPFWFGKDTKGKLVFALPGNPVSTQICFYRYVLPALQKITGVRRYGHETVVFRGKSTGPKDLTLFLPVKLKSAGDGKLHAVARPISHSGDFVGLADSDGFVQIDKSSSRQKGSGGFLLPFYRW